MAREAIIGAAVDLIREEGVSGMSISDVIARSGTSAGAIYHHFGNKEQLVLEVGRSAIAIPMAMIMQTSPDLSPDDLFRAALDQVARNEHTAKLLLQIWAGAQSEPALAELLHTEVNAMREAVRTFVDAWSLEHAPGADPAAISDIVIGLVMGFAVQRALSVDNAPVEYREYGARLLQQAPQNASQST